MVNRPEAWFLTRPKHHTNSFTVGAATEFCRLEISASLVTNLFNENRAALVVNGPWFLGEIAEGVPFGALPTSNCLSDGRTRHPPS